MSAGSSCPRLRPQSLYLCRCHRTGSSIWGSFSHHGLGGLLHSSTAADLGSDPGPLQPHGVPDCPAKWVHAGWPGQLLGTHAAHCLLFLMARACLLPPGVSSPLIHMHHRPIGLLLQNKFKEKIIKNFKMARAGIKPKAGSILRAGLCVTAQVTCP